MKFWITDYRSDPDVRLMKIDERGIYLEIIFELFEQGGTMEFDLNRIAKLINVNPRKLVKVWGKVSFKFELSEGQLQHKRVNTELKLIDEKSEKARNSVNSRWQKDTNVIRTNNERNTTHSHSQSHSHIKPKVNSESIEKSETLASGSKKPISDKTKRQVSALINNFKAVFDTQNSIDTPNTKKLLNGLVRLRELPLDAERLLGLIVQARNADGIRNRLAYCIKIITDPAFAVGDSYLQTAKVLIRKWRDEGIDPRVKKLTEG